MGERVLALAALVAPPGLLGLIERHEREFVALGLVGGQPADVDARVIVGARVSAFHDGEPAFARVVPDDVVALEVRRGASRAT